MNRRTFLGVTLAAAAASAQKKPANREPQFGWMAPAPPKEFDVAAWEKKRVVTMADRYMTEKPVTVTASRAAKSPGDAHDYYSQSDYWWPDPQNPSGPYIQRDGMSNPENFDDHRKAMRRLSVQVPALTAAWKITGQTKYADHAALHLRAWFVDEATKMNPSLLYSQGVIGRSTGRGTGVIDTIHLVEVARSAELLHKSLSAAKQVVEVRGWFAEYTQWLWTHEYGKAEREAANNHGTCYAMQIAQFAKLTGDEAKMKWASDRFKTVFVPNQIAPDGSFPQELRRTKPYGYSLFNLDAMTTVCQILATSKDNLWMFTLPDGRGIAKSLAYMYPYIKDKKKWPLPPDVMYDQEWPMRQPSLIFGGLALNQPEYVDLWKTLPADSTVDEVIRNLFLRQPVLWI